MNSSALGIPSVALTSPEYFPAAHEEHVARPTDDVYFPAAQPEQTEATAAEYWPLEHVGQEAAELSEYRPDAQLLQPAWPADPWYWPAPHARQAVRSPAVPYWPDGHAVHVDVPEAAVM
jgi:hypothetical protein